MRFGAIYLPCFETLPLAPPSCHTPRSEEPLVALPFVWNWRTKLRRTIRREASKRRDNIKPAGLLPSRGCDDAHRSRREMVQGESDWRDAALASLLRAASARLRAATLPAASEAGSPADVARDLLGRDALLPALHALAPAATTAALALLDAALRASRRADLFDDAGAPLARPRLFRDVVHVCRTAHDHRCLVKVQSSSSAAAAARGRAWPSAPQHIVLLSGARVDVRRNVVYFEDDDNEDSECDGGYGDNGGYVNGDNHADGDADDTEDLPVHYFRCDCRAFEFKHGGDRHCKHIVSAGIAIASDMASYSILSDGDFVALLTPT
jgi:hypothetical protein